MTQTDQHNRSFLRIATVLPISVVRSVLNFVSGILLTRYLGVSDYGFYAFFIASLLTLKPFIDPGISDAVFTIGSSRRRSNHFFSAMLWLVLSQVAIGTLLYISFAAQTYQDTLQISFLSVTLGFFALLLQQFIWPTLTRVGEIFRLTAKIAVISTVVAALHIVLLTVGYYYGKLDITFVFLLLFFEWVIANIALVLLIRGTGEFSTFRVRVPSKMFTKVIVQQIMIYVGPILVYLICSSLIWFCVRWILQIWGGAENQGYFALASHIAASFLVFSMISTQVFWRENAELEKKKRLEEHHKLLDTTIGNSLLISSVLAGMLHPIIGDFLVAASGKEFAAAELTAKILIFYGMLQGVSQISGSYYQSTYQTRIYAKIMTISQLVFFATYALVFVFFAQGLSAFSDEILASLMLITQITVTFILLRKIYIQKGWYFPFGKIVFIPVFFVSLGYVCKGIISLLPVEILPNWDFILIVLVYSISLFFIFKINPKFLLLSEYHIDNIAVYWLSKIRFQFF